MSTTTLRNMQIRSINQAERAETGITSFHFCKISTTARQARRLKKIDKQGMGKVKKFGQSDSSATIFLISKISITKRF